MLSLSKLRSKSGGAAKAAAYARGDVTAAGVADDYYSEGGSAPSAFIGSGVDALNIGGYSDEKLMRLLECFHPKTGQPLTKSAGNDVRVMGCDLTFSAPKSVSALWAVADDAMRERIQEAHTHAVDAAFAHIEDHLVLGRRGQGGREHERVSLIASRHEHGTSRAGDPDLHSHTLLINVGVRSDGSTCTLDYNELFRHKMAAGAIYRAELAAQMQSMGFSVSRDDTSFKIDGVSKELCDTWSKRHGEIEEKLNEKGLSGAKAAEVASLDTRHDKEHLSREHVMHAWREEAAAHGFDADAVYALTEREAVADAGHTMITQAELLERVTAMESVFSVHEIWKEVATAAQGHLDKNEIEQFVGEALRSDELMLLSNDDSTGAVYTTRTMHRIEREAMTTLRTMATQSSHHVDKSVIDDAIDTFRIAKRFALSEQQKSAVQHVCAAAGVSVVVGEAGAGKSTLLEASNIAWQAAGYNVRGAALSGKAASGLEESSGIKSQTLHSLLLALEQDDNGNVKEQLTSRDVIVVDEAGMCDSRTYSRIVKHAQVAGAKLVLVGDHRQLQAVAAGGLFKHAVAELQSVELTEVRRHKDADMLSMAKSIRAGDVAAGLQRLVDRNALHIHDDREAALDATVEKWSSQYDRFNVNATVMIASTNAECDALNERARNKMKAMHQLSNEASFQARDKDGNAIGKIKIAEGERIVFLKNDKTLGVKNGEIATVSSVMPNNVGQHVYTAVIESESGARTVKFTERDYAQVKHAYAITTHKSQGMTVDNAVVLGGRTSLEATYVQLTRMKNSVDLVLTKTQIEREAATLAPTDRMLDYARDLADQKQIELPAEAEHDFLICRDFLNENAPERIEQDGMPAWKEDIKDVITAMSQSRQKVTTLDYVSDVAANDARAEHHNIDDDEDYA